MRLVNATTLKLEVFNDASHRPPYAILSHRWVEGYEITFDTMQQEPRQMTSEWHKIETACRQTLADNLKYIWVDICCTDKSSSSELSEAINSMYTWYSEAECCYACLNDVQISQYDRASGKRLTLDDARVSRAKAVEGIVNSAWFSPAWTLQELIAPLQLVFFDSARDPTAGLVVSDNPIYGTKPIEAGFDSDFRPVVILATENSAISTFDHIWPGRYTSLDRCRAGSASIRRGLSRSQYFLSLKSDTWRSEKRHDWAYNEPISVNTGIYLFTTHTSDPENGIGWWFTPYSQWHRSNGQSVPIIGLSLYTRSKNLDMRYGTNPDMNYWRLSVFIKGYELVEHLPGVGLD